MRYGDRRWRLGAPTVFSVLMALAIISACSSGHQSFTPVPQAAGSRAGNDHRRHVKRDDFYNPPRVVYGTGGSYCWMTTAQSGPGTWPFWSCLLKSNDSVQFNNLWQVAGYLQPTWNCSETYWAIPENHAGNPDGVSAQIVPTVTGGDGQCNRLDTVSVTISRDSNTAVGWNDSFQALGDFAWCSAFSCGGNNAEVAGNWGVAPLPSPPPSPLPTPCPTSPSQPNWPTPQPSPQLLIYDNILKEFVSYGNTMPNTVVGMQQSLTAETSNGQPISSPSWVYINSPWVVGQTFTDAAASYTTPAPGVPSANPVKFYWISANTQAVVEVTALSSGASAMAVYNVEAPTSVSMTATFATPSIIGPANGWAITLSATPPALTGITSNYSASAPPDYAGYYAENQVIAVNALPSPSGIYVGPTSNPSGTYYDDACAFWYTGLSAQGINEFVGPMLFSKGSSVTYPPTWDSPQQPIGQAGLKSLQLDDEFVDSFIFRPASTGSGEIWVVLGQLAWQFGGTAVLNQTNGTWSLASSIIPSPNPTSSPLGWPNRFGGGGTDCPPSPPPLERSRSRHTSGPRLKSEKLPLHPDFRKEQPPR